MALMVNNPLSPQNRSREALVARWAVLGGPAVGARAELRFIRDRDAVVALGTLLETSERGRASRQRY
jgi:hypothetical protein